MSNIQSNTALKRRSVVTPVLAALCLMGCAAHKAAHHERRARYAQIPRQAYAVVAEVRARPGMEDALRNATLPLVAQVRNEPNNRLYFLHEDREAPGHFIFYEIFASQADFEGHNATRHVQDWFATLPDLADGQVHVTRMKLLGNASVLSQHSGGIAPDGKP